MELDDVLEENNVSRGFINVFCRRGTGLPRREKLSELNFFIRKTFTV